MFSPRRDGVAAMVDTVRAKRIYILGNPDKRDTGAAVERLAKFAGPRCTVVGTGFGVDARAAGVAGAQRVVVVGGDGTLIGVARSLGDAQLPLIGVNVGKLGFLTEFSLSELEADFDGAISDDSRISRRTILHVSVQRRGAGSETALAINDCVLQAGPPFRMIDLGVSINDAPLTQVAGDGLIVCTPSGSTAHNLSAGGPIMQPDVDAIILTPLCPHSLTHRPLVITRESVIEILACHVNPGTTAIIDGQVSCPLGPGDRVSIRRHAADFLVVRNARYAPWHQLISKLHWGQAPSYGS